MNRVVSLLLGLNSFTILERKTLTANDRNLQYMNIKIDDEIDIEDYSLLIRYKQVDGKIFADVYSIEKDNDIQIPNSILEFPQTLTIEFCYISNKNDNRITIPRKLQLNVVDTYDTIVEPDDVVVGVSVADIIKEIPKKTEEGKAEIEKSKDEAIEELKKHSDSNVEESKELINSFTSQKQEQLDTYTKTKESQLEEYVTAKKGELDSHTTQKKNELNTHEKAKERELDNYVTTVNKPELDKYTNIKKEELNSHTKTKESEITQVTETKKQEITAHGASELDKFNQGAKQEADKQIGRVVAEGDVQVQRVKDESGGVIPRIENLESGKVSKSGDTMTGNLVIDVNGSPSLSLWIRGRKKYKIYGESGGLVIHNSISEIWYQFRDDGTLFLQANNLQTQSKEVVFAINELNSKKSDLTGSTFTGLVAVKKDTNGEAMVALNSAYGNGDIYSGGSAKGVGFRNRTSGKGLFLGDDGSVKLEATNIDGSEKDVIKCLNLNIGSFKGRVQTLQDMNRPGVYTVAEGTPDTPYNTWGTIINMYEHGESGFNKQLWLSTGTSGYLAEKSGPNNWVKYWSEANFDPSTKLDKSSVVNDLTSGGTDKVLSAEQGKLLKQQIDSLTNEIEQLKQQIAEMQK